MAVAATALLVLAVQASGMSIPNGQYAAGCHLGYATNVDTSDGCTGTATVLGPSVLISQQYCVSGTECQELLSASLKYDDAGHVTLTPDKCSSNVLVGSGDCPCGYHGMSAQYGYTLTNTIHGWMVKFSQTLGIWKESSWSGIVTRDKDLYSCSNKGMTLGAAVAVCIGSVVGVVLLAWLGVILYRKHKRSKQGVAHMPSPQYSTQGTKHEAHDDEGSSAPLMSH